MKRYFCETDGYNLVLFVDDAGHGVPVHETAFDRPLTLDAAVDADYSSLEGFERAEDAAANYTGEVIDFRETDYSQVTEF